MNHDEASRIALEIAAKQAHLWEDVLLRADAYYVWLRRDDPMVPTTAPTSEAAPPRGRRQVSGKPVDGSG